MSSSDLFDIVLGHFDIQHLWITMSCVSCEHCFVQNCQVAPGTPCFSLCDNMPWGFPFNEWSSVLFWIFTEYCILSVWIDVQCQKWNDVAVKIAALARLFIVLDTVVCCLATCVENIVTVSRTNYLSPCLPVIQASSIDCRMFSQCVVGW